MPQYRNRIREERSRAGIDSQAELGRRTGICRTTLCALENNRKGLTIHNAMRIKAALGCTLDDLYEESSRPMRGPETGRSDEPESN